MSNQLVSDIYNNINNLKWWFLLGTEIPDSRYSYALTLRTSCNNIVSSNKFGTSHQLSYSGPTYSLVTLCPLARELLKVTTLASEGLLKHDCQFFAYYAGALVHLISDATYYPHLYSAGNNDLQLMYRVTYLTDTIYLQESPYEFFNIDEASYYFDGFDEAEPSLALFRAGLDTRCGNTYQMSFTSQLYKDAAFMYEKRDASFNILKYIADLDNVLRFSRFCITEYR